MDYGHSGIGSFGKTANNKVWINNKLNQEISIRILERLLKQFSSMEAGLFRGIQGLESLWNKLSVFNGLKVNFLQVT